MTVDARLGDCIVYSIFTILAGFQKILDYVPVTIITSFPLTLSTQSLWRMDAQIHQGDQASLVEMEFFRYFSIQPKGR
jgi:hypothetical protein